MSEHTKNELTIKGDIFIKFFTDLVAENERLREALAKHATPIVRMHELCNDKSGEEIYLNGVRIGRKEDGAYTANFVLGLLDVHKAIDYRLVYPSDAPDEPTRDKKEPK